MMRQESEALLNPPMDTSRLPPTSRPAAKAPELQRGLSTASALGLNVIDMVGLALRHIAVDCWGDGRSSSDIGLAAGRAALDV